MTRQGLGGLVLGSWGGREWNDDKVGTGRTGIRKMGRTGMER